MLKISDPVNLKLIIQYDGSDYFGWQAQPKRNTVQQTIQNALRILLPKCNLNIIGAGRTDTGVHALNQCANFFIEKSVYKNLNIKKFIHSLNAILPDDIVIKKISRVNLNFNARYSAISREYFYLFSKDKSAIFRNYVLHIKQSFDLKLAKKFCSLIIGTHCFKSFCKNKSDKHNFNCIIYNADVFKTKLGIYKFKITANRFLHSMVRALVSVMLKISSDKLSIDDFKNLFLSNQTLKIQYAPSYALFLSKINY